VATWILLIVIVILTLCLLSQIDTTSMQSHASNDSTSEASFLTMDAFCDSVATSLSLVWN
jgi:hypothetical protein